jgi:hypothetical protein
MPTGYTAELCEKGQTFEEFVWRCARAFGALILLRDDALDAPIPDSFKSSDYAEKSLVEANEKLERALHMTLKDAERESAAEYARRVDETRESNARTAAVRKRLEDMRARVVGWKPPTKDHEGLRDFMLQQLSETIKFDGREMEMPERQKPDDWLRDHIEHARRVVEVCLESIERERNAAASRNAWIAQLRNSVPIPPKMRAKGK